VASAFTILKDRSDIDPKETIGLIVPASANLIYADIGFAGVGWLVQ
jgi:hypothetical protein